MKDYIGEHNFWNAPIKNPTQNKYTRFLRMPRGKLTSKYWYEGDNNRLKSVYFEDKL